MKLFGRWHFKMSAQAADKFYIINCTPSPLAATDPQTATPPAVLRAYSWGRITPQASAARLELTQQGARVGAAERAEAGAWAIVEPPATDRLRLKLLGGGGVLEVFVVTSAAPSAVNALHVFNLTRENLQVGGRGAEEPICVVEPGACCALSAAIEVASAFAASTRAQPVIFAIDQVWAGIACRNTPGGAPGAPAPAPARHAYVSQAGRAGAGICMSFVPSPAYHASGGCFVVLGPGAEA
jgi:hypothetical protein